MMSEFQQDSSTAPGANPDSGSSSALKGTLASSKGPANSSSSTENSSNATKKQKPALKLENMPTPRIYMNNDDKPGSILVKENDPKSADVTAAVANKNAGNGPGSTSSLLDAIGREPQHKKTPSVHAHFLEGETEPGLRSRSASGSDKALDADSHPRNAFARDSNLEAKKFQSVLAGGASSSASSIERASSPEKKALTASSASSSAVAPGGTASSSTAPNTGSSSGVNNDPRLPTDDGKIHILLGATGSISTGKLREIINKLGDIYGKDKVSIQIILTQAAEHFVSRGEIPSSVRIWRDNDEWKTWRTRTDPVLHIELRRWADILVICPLSANTLGKIALGLCDNLLTNVIRAWNTQYPILIAPAMLSYAYNHPATKRHLKVIQEDMKWIEVLKPVEKVVGSYGDIGMGGMMDWVQIVDKVVMKLGGYPDDEDEDEDEDEETRIGEDEDDEDEDEDDDQGAGLPGASKLKKTGDVAVVDEDDDEDLGVQGLSLAEQENYEKTHKKLRSSKSFS